MDNIVGADEVAVVVAEKSRGRGRRGGAQNDLGERRRGRDVAVRHARVKVWEKK